MTKKYDRYYDPDFPLMYNAKDLPYMRYIYNDVNVNSNNTQINNHMKYFLIMINQFNGIKYGLILDTCIFYFS